MDCPSARTSIRYFWHRVKAGVPVNPPDCKVLYRAHFVRAGEPKVRAVYGYPTTMTLGEAQFALPLINAYKCGRYPIAYNYDMACGGARKVRREMVPLDHYGCFDFKDFDKTVPKALIRVAFEILLSNIDFRRYQDAGVPHARRLFKAWKYIVEYFINTPLRMHTGERFKKTAGVPSGSYFTQLVDSIVNYIVLTYAFLKGYGRYPDYIKVLGDDSVIACRDPFSKFVIAEHIDGLGMIVNPSKSLVTDNIDEIEFLGFTLTNGLPHRPLAKWCSSLYHPEFPDQCWDDFASRALGLLYANRGIEGTFDRMCRMVIAQRPFQLTFKRDQRRFLAGLGVDIGSLSLSVPERESLVFDLG